MDADVVISGAGPTGLLLASELALAGVRVRVLERRLARHQESRALTLHPRSIEIMDLRGIADRFLELGRTVPGWHFAGLPQRLDFSALRTRHGYCLFLEQARVERVLEGRARELGVEISYGHELLAVAQDEDGVEVAVRAPGGESGLRAAYVVGCDGGRSRVRDSAGIGFPGTDATMTSMLGDFMVIDHDAIAAVGEDSPVLIAPLESGATRLVVTDPLRMRVPASEPVTFEEFRDALVRMAGSSFGIAEPRWLSRFGNATRLAEAYRAGRVLLAGDAAHIHFPAAGQGLNTGLQDAMNLGWKLAAEINGWAPAALLDSYHTERHAVGRTVTANTQAQTLLLELTLLPDYRQPVTALRELMNDLLQIPEVNSHLAALVSALGISYASSDDDPLVGARMPDIPSTTTDGRRLRVSELLHTGRFAYLDFTGAREGAAAVAAGWGDRVEVMAGDPPSTAGDLAEVLVRPDGHVAWVRRRHETPDVAARESALRTWAGAPRQAAVTA
ncbi:FAD-dependent monooxygenase [Actinoallomurus rhizosphaericola]|uniref:FAD-dependent monooxygenase n=1 Tax=Actinoallomurus rhizosphaericola TaxID=2952536 RepID=UPI00209203AD|nr:FAD-dependent monooxygenase [Actinoallomurus rhizosphaericola]MCO5995802.1 FAD-dependent monooxygenase [Actinoallomurus rhizosphaericola]